MTLDEMMGRFRIASRELFNHHFHVAGASGAASAPPPHAPREAGGEAWELQMRFAHIEEVLFEKMVSEPAGLKPAPYGGVQPQIAVELRSDFCPIMLNREIDSGYWDFPVREVTRDARLRFVSFFDWDILDYRDYRYVLVQVDAWPAHPETAGKRALVETQYVCFAAANPAT